MRDAKPKLSFLNTLFDQRQLIREKSISLSSEDHVQTLKPSVSIPKCIINLWKPHARREDIVRSQMVRDPDQMLFVSPVRGLFNSVDRDLV